MTRTDPDGRKAHTSGCGCCGPQHFEPPDGTAFFGPIISALPSPKDAVRLRSFSAEPGCNREPEETASSATANGS